MIYRMSFVNLDDDVDHYCCNAFDGLANGDDSFYLEKLFIKISWYEDDFYCYWSHWKFYE